jgi:hypothetical protein
MNHDIWTIANNVICVIGAIAIVFLISGATYSFINLVKDILSWI